ncbi:MAG TPA: hypothetical protein PJ982_07905, partial [Lacipirellulaceae bacterium]|nr:hypothetical protein [Lacipirellulaceae bacterium]
CLGLSRQFHKRPRSRIAQGQSQAAVRQALRWADAAGRPLLANGRVPPWSPDFVAALLRDGGRRSDWAAVPQWPAPLRPKGSKQQAASSPPTCPSSLCDEAAQAVLRSDWSGDALVAAADFRAVECPLHVSAAGVTLLEGPWTAQLRAGDQALHAVGPWESVCWFTDRDVAYLELTLPLSDGASLDRQLLLARGDRFLLLVDHLRHPVPTRLELAWSVPLAPSVKWRGEAETRDALLGVDRPLARLLPLAQPEWRIDPRVGELSQADGALRVAQHAVGSVLAAPLFIDLAPSRVNKPCTWRQLTVAESLRIVAPDEAVGYRVQCGRDQWIYYRSQAACGNRTVLGQNTSNECLIARFLPKTGGIEELLEIES